MLTARRYRVRGRVQGVGYRFFTREIALKLGVHGHVRNLPNGDVEVLGEAAGEVLDRFCDQLKRGPGFSRVSDVVEEPVPVRNYSSFEIRG